jgi:glycerol uptake facilitator-like aquaporin
VGGGRLDRRGVLVHRLHRFANPAVTIGRTLTSTYAGIAPVSAPAFIAAQLVGGAIGTLLALTLYPARPTPVRGEQPAQLAR